MAEREGFEPSIPTRSITIFETVAFDRSAISPLKIMRAIKHIILIYILQERFASFLLLFCKKFLYNDCYDYLFYLIQNKYFSNFRVLKYFQQYQIHKKC